MLGFLKNIFKKNEAPNNQPTESLEQNQSAHEPQTVHSEPTDNNHDKQIEPPKPAVEMSEDKQFDNADETDKQPESAVIQKDTELLGETNVAELKQPEDTATLSIQDDEHSPNNMENRQPETEILVIGSDTTSLSAETNKVQAVDLTESATPATSTDMFDGASSADSVMESPSSWANPNAPINKAIINSKNKESNNESITHLADSATNTALENQNSVSDTSAVIVDELQGIEDKSLHSELMPIPTQPEPKPTPAAAAATDLDESNLPHYVNTAPSSQPNFQAAAPVMAAESVSVFAGDEEVAQNWTARLAKGLSKSRNQMAKSLAGVFGGGKIDEDLYEELETVLITSDMGIEATEYLMQEVRQRVSLRGLKDGKELRQALKEAIYDLIKSLEQPLEIPNNGQPFVIMMAGINGAGKTTSIGKLAKYFQSQGKTVMLAAGDTFRAAAREQLQEWGERNGVTVISQASGDSAAVCFDAVESAKAKGIDVVLADTAGRLPTQLHLMEEIKKVKRVLQKAMPDAPHEVMVVLDANIGQNAINQVVAFDDALGVTGLIVSKLDGTAKGGILAALASNRPIPVRYIGVGEHIDDLRPFNARAFVEALMEEKA